jgi:predicted aspartyl protease
MGVTYVRARLRRPDGRGPTRSVRFLVDSGAIYSVLPEETWRALRLKAERQVEFTLADGTPMTRGVSECRFEIRGEAAASPVVLGEEHDGALLGAVTLETLGLMLNPLTREILPMRMALSHHAVSGRPNKELQATATGRHSVRSWWRVLWLLSRDVGPNRKDSIMSSSLASNGFRLPHAVGMTSMTIVEQSGGKVKALTLNG